jgi:hypothetical protein
MLFASNQLNKLTHIILIRRYGSIEPALGVRGIAIHI